MPRPEIKEITFTLDGVEVTAPENEMLVDAAKLGDVEIPVFCYEPKLGNPVGACRMCLVEIEGIPKLQTGCSTPVKDGMVVHTQTQRVRDAQQHVVEFLLINHPLDCPVCDKGGECPLQDISYGWGGGISRFIEPKRHFQKPLELSPLIAIDRERCILCYRCVRFSQEIAEDYQLVLHERGAQTFVGTFDGHPYVAPFSGNIIELCPVGALTSQPYRFRARPWDIEGSGSVCTLCPAQCNVEFTVRDERVLRVLDRMNTEVDDGWLCDKGRFAYQAVHVDERVTAPMIRDGGVLREVSWELALERAAESLGKAGNRTAAIVGGETTNEEGFLLQRLLREGLGSPDVLSAGVESSALHALLDPALQARVTDLEYADTVLVLGTEPVDDIPILDLRLRKGVRQNRVKLAVATPRPSSLDPSAQLSVRYAPGGEAAFVAALTAAVFGGDVDEPARSAGVEADAVRGLGELLRTGGGDVVVLWGTQLLSRGASIAPNLLKLARGLNLHDDPSRPAGLLGVPAGTNARGLLEAGVADGVGPGFTPIPAGLGLQGVRDALTLGEITGLYLLHDDPLVSRPDRAAWDRALEKATTVVAHAEFLSDGLRAHATVIFPAESYAEKEGTLVHPDGRLQRLRPAIGRQGLVRPEWQVIAELARRLGHDLGVLTGPMASAQLFAAVPFYAGLTLDEIGGTGVRWQDRPAAAAFPAPPEQPVAGITEYASAATPNQGGSRENGGVSDPGALRLGSFRSIWASPQVAVSPALKFLHPRQRVEMAPADAEHLGLTHGDRVVVGSDGASVQATVSLRQAAPAGTVFLEDGLPTDAANNVEGPLVDIRKVGA